MKTKTLGIAVSVLLVLLCFAGCAQKEDTAATTAPTTHANAVIRCSTTTSVNDSGLMTMLEPLFEAETGYDLQITSNGSGAAIKLGETGDADVLLVHSKAAEEKFVSDGFGLKRIPFMYNFFVIAGPAADPASIAASTTASDAFKKIATAKSPFISRGDNSGTNTKEIALWTAAGFTPDAAADKWYVSTGKGMGASLIVANEMKGYILTDKATFLSNKANLAELKIVLNESDDMKNTYSLIACNPEKNAGLNAEGAQDFITWMTKQATLDKIAAYGTDTYGEALFLLSK